MELWVWGSLGDDPGHLMVSQPSRSGLLVVCLHPIISSPKHSGLKQHTHLFRASFWAAELVLCSGRTDPVGQGWGSSAGWTGACPLAGLGQGRLQAPLGCGTDFLVVLGRAPPSRWLLAGSPSQLLATWPPNMATSFSKVSKGEGRGHRQGWSWRCVYVV